MAVIGRWLLLIGLIHSKTTLGNQKVAVIGRWLLLIGLIHSKTVLWEIKKVAVIGR